MVYHILAAEVKSQHVSLNTRFDRLEAMIFNNNNISLLQASGKAPIHPGPPHPLDPPDLTGYNQRGDCGRLSSRLSKVTFLAFDGIQLRNWISKCVQFFDIDGTPSELKVRFAAIHLTGKATQWHHNYMSTRYNLFRSWTDYIIAISARFSELFDDPLAEIVALKEGSDSVSDCLDKYEISRMRLVFLL